MTVYKVVGAAFQGHQPGDEFEAELDPALERRAKARGQLRVVKRGDKPDQPEQEQEEEADAEKSRP